MRKTKVLFVVVVVIWPLVLVVANDFALGVVMKFYFIK